MSQSSEFQYDVFLSHNQADKPRVRQLAERLRAAGPEPKAECGRQNAEVLPSTFFIHPFSPVGLERSTVLFRDPANAGRRFIPLLLADCKLPDTLRRYKYVDYRDEAEAAFAELLAGCRTNGAATALAPAAHALPPQSSSSSSSATSEYLRFRREAIERVFANFEPIHAFFFKICVDYMSLVESLHAGVPASDSERDKYYAYVREIGRKLDEIHILEGRLKVAGADLAVRAMQQYRLQATEVNNMLQLQQPRLRASGVRAVADELFRRKDRFYEELAKALKPV